MIIAVDHLIFNLKYVIANIEKSARTIEIKLKKGFHDSHKTIFKNFILFSESHGLVNYHKNQKQFVCHSFISA